MPQPVPSSPMAFNTFSSYSTALPSQPQGQLPVTAWEAYDCVLTAAIYAEGRGRRKLAIKGDWDWLLTEFASTYGVRRTYASLAYLAWAVRYLTLSIQAKSFTGPPSEQAVFVGALNQTLLLSETVP
ncbi:hypothetical protein ABBQ38_001508 [Trebouxia sp. C0009 RCD-2024]